MDDDWGYPYDLGNFQMVIAIGLVQGLVNVPFWGFWTSFSRLCWRLHIPNIWVMFNWDIYQPLWFEGHFTGKNISLNGEKTYSCTTFEASELVNDFFLLIRHFVMENEQ